LRNQAMSTLLAGTHRRGPLSRRYRLVAPEAPAGGRRHRVAPTPATGSVPDGATGGATSYNLRP